MQWGLALTLESCDCCSWVDEGSRAGPGAGNRVFLRQLWGERGKGLGLTLSTFVKTWSQISLCSSQSTTYPPVYRAEQPQALQRNTMNTGTRWPQALQGNAMTLVCIGPGRCRGTQ